MDKAYKNAKFVLSYGKDITKCVKSAFPFCSNKIQESAYSLDKKDFNFSIKKINMITYMPREFPEHSSHLMFFLRNSLPKNWRIKTIHNLNEKDVYNIEWCASREGHEECVIKFDQDKPIDYKKRR